MKQLITASVLSLLGLLLAFFMLVDVLQAIDVLGFVVEHTEKGDSNPLISMLLGLTNIVALTLCGLVIIVAFMAINSVKQIDFKILCVFQIPFIVFYVPHVGSLSGNWSAGTYGGYMMAVFITYSYVYYFVLYYVFRMISTSLSAKEVGNNTADNSERNQA